MKNFFCTPGLYSLDFFLHYTVGKLHNLRDRSVGGIFFFVKLLPEHLKVIAYILNVPQNFEWSDFFQIETWIEAEAADQCLCCEIDQTGVIFLELIEFLL